MGKLADRLADASRSGTYRVESIEALVEAAALNGFALRRVLLNEGLPGTLVPEDGRVLLLSGFEGLAPAALSELVRQLEAAAAECREGGKRFFAAFLDPGALLPLAPLYNWTRGG